MAVVPTLVEKIAPVKTVKMARLHFTYSDTTSAEVTNHLVPVQ